MKKYHSLSRDIITRFCLFAVFLSLLFSLFNFAFLYTVEDFFIERSVKNEAAYLLEQYRSGDNWLAPRKPNMTLHHSVDSFPEEIKGIYQEEPRRKEFFGKQGRHYHMVKIDTSPSKYLIAEVSEQLVVRPLRPFIFILLSISTLVLTLIACFIAYRLSKRTIAPLTKLADLVAGASPNKLPAKFAQQYPANEIGVLATTIEGSMQRIKDFVSREQHFTRDVSHELRTPIAVIKNSGELLAADKGLSGGNRELLAQIEQACLNMEQTVNTLLSLAREESSQTNTEPVRVLPEVEQVVIQHAALLDGKDVRVNLDIDSDARVNIHRGTLQILISNLVSNAFQYTMAGEVSIRWKHGYLEVFDTGPGLEDDIKDSILEPMVKGKDSPGFGLGLSIVKRLCEHHGFALSIENQANGMMVRIEFNRA